jgi:proteasome lid subunit RPN8/RPN11
MSRRVQTAEISAGALTGIRRLAESAYPHEGCGVLIGADRGDVLVIDEVTSARNLWTERAADRYDLDPADLLAAERSARAAGKDVVGIWHSHPDHPAQPSQFDADRAWIDYVYVIVRTVAGGSEAANAFSLEEEGGAFAEIPMLVREGSS